jgi:hypothetical protein
VVIGPRSIQQISQFIFLNLNTQRDQFVRAVITQTQSKLKRSNTIVQNVILIIVQCTIIRASRTPDQVEGP